MITQFHPIQIGSEVHYNNENAYSFDGMVLALNEETNKALVQWVDCLGQHRQMLVAVRCLTVLEKQTAEAVAPAVA